MVVDAPLESAAVVEYAMANSDALRTVAVAVAAAGELRVTATRSVLAAIKRGLTELLGPDWVVHTRPDVPTVVDPDEWVVVRNVSWPEGVGETLRVALVAGSHNRPNVLSGLYIQVRQRWGGESQAVAQTPLGRAIESRLTKSKDAEWLPGWWRSLASHADWTPLNALADLIDNPGAVIDELAAVSVAVADAAMATAG